ncbi:MAG: 5'/3'-nucleotidase SurE [Deltaproteobacteria bacterium]|nr:5'/3'-nucleotidase SurE [Deltaproteobacteria bacterium]MBW2049958.1 5'/3'-nucleotidase SurE [Deltaproteobacteria bacterium]MBW2112297.1 5'/3'-nucleotidase SurE [Deltaproteobacteria bacterium]MBW2352714.1 5'/3'-nucleotidase SurE [Deltaproteobacteria bacterium]
MRILLTNDDGIHAPGLFALYEALKQDHQVHIVAPESEMSAVGHAITLTSPIVVQEVHRDGLFFGHAVKGTPADCVKLAVKELLDSPPDVILSGINVGANVGVNILYSGTVSAATEGAFLGIRSAAISLAVMENPDFRFAAQFSRDLVRFMVEADLRDGTALNVNIPALPPEKISGISITRQGTSRFEERFERRTDPRGRVYYWLTGEKFIETGNPENDSVALGLNRITITPIHYDLTCERELVRLKTLDLPPLALVSRGKTR